MGTVLPRLPLVVVVLLAALAAGGAQSSMTIAAARIPAPKQVDCTTKSADAAYPLRVRGQHLVDAHGRPFLINGDAAWSLIAQLRDDDVDRYLADRKARGFNAVLVNLVEHTYASKAPANIYGAQPLRVENDFATPNEAYFDHADSVIQKAAARGMLVVLDPAYFGFSGDGWYDAIEANGAERMEQYGRYVGERYAGCRNIIWVIGGDRTPKDTTTGDALARGILAAAPKALITAHADSEAPVDRIWGRYAWLRLNSLFTYEGVWSRAVALRKRSRKPFFLIESAYENDGWHRQTPTRMRTQAYQAILGGATGNVFGNNPIWHFDGPGCCSPVEFPTTWQKALGLEGSKSMSVMRRILSAYRWDAMTPDTDATFVTAGLSRELDRIAASVANDRSLGMAFVPSSRTIRVNLNRLRGPAELVWIDPTNGVRRRIATSATGRVSLATPGTNARRGQDWLLVAQTRSAAGRRNSTGVAPSR